MHSLISHCKLPLAAPSANTSGKPSPTNAKRVIEDLYGKVDAIIDGGECSFGLESTVVDTTSKPFTILRPGAITYDMIKEVIGHITIDPAIITHNLSLNQKPKAPGMKYTHYSPNAQVVIVQGEISQVISKIKDLCLEETKNGKSIGILATDELLEAFSPYFVLSAGKSMESLGEIASNLFEVLRKFDDHKVDIVYSIAFPSLGIGQAIMNRLEKSSGYTFINA
jgi:L-threonylcarbamoyladenylate synthase